MKSIEKLADQLGVTPAIIRSWQINLNLEHPRYAPEEPVYGVEWETFFQDVARLRKQGQSFSKIRALLTPTMPSEQLLPQPGAAVKPPANGNGGPAGRQAEQPQAETPEAEAGVSFSFSSRERRPLPPSEDPGQALVQLRSENKLVSVQHLQKDMHEALLTQDLSRMAQTYVQLMENYQTLASRYSESAYVLGQLEEKNRSLEHQLEDKAQHFAAQEQAKQERIEELEAHLQTLKQSLQHREADLTQHKTDLVTKEQISQVEKQIKMLAVTVFQQQEKQAQSQPQGFWQKLKQRWF